MVLQVGGMVDRRIVEAYVDFWTWVVKGVLRAEVVRSVSVSVDSRHHGVVGGHEGVVGVGAEPGHTGDSQRRPVLIACRLSPSPIHDGTISRPHWKEGRRESVGFNIGSHLSSGKSCGVSNVFIWRLDAERRPMGPKRLSRCIISGKLLK